MLQIPGEFVTVLPAAQSGHPRPRGRAWLQVGSLTHFEWTRLSVPIDGLPQALWNLRIVHLTDLHVRARWERAYDHLIARLSHDPPDIIAITGDLVEDRMDARPALPVLRRLIAQLCCRLGVFAVTGNHDGDLLGPMLRSWAVHFISRRYARLEEDDAAMELVGLPGVRRRDFDLEFVQGIPPRQSGVPRIVLAHYPDQIRMIGSVQADVMLAGHTHGGQVCLPGGHPIVTRDRLPRSLARGPHRVGQTLLVVNRGLGFARWRVRAFCPAEVVELRLTSGATGEANAAPAS